MEFNETWQEARSQRPLPRLCFSGRSEKQDGRPGLWLAETFSTSPLKPLNGIQRNLTGSKISTSSTKFVFFGPIGKTRWPPLPLIGWDIFDFSSETAERNSTKLDRKQDLNIVYQVCVFRADRKNKMAALASDWLRHFRLLLWNHWTELNETWQVARSQCRLPSLCFSGRSEKQDGRPGLWLAETFLTSPLKPLNGIQRNLTGSKISTSSTKFVFFGPIGKTRWPPWPLIGWDIFDFSSETAEWNSTKLDRKQDLNVVYQVCIFRADLKNKMAVLASDWLRHFLLLLWNRSTEFNKTWQEARSQRPLPSLCFSGRSEKQDGRPCLWLAETFKTSPLKPLNGIERNLTGSKISTSSTKFVFFGLIGKTRWPPWPLIGWDIFEVSSPLKPLNGIQPNFTGSKISTSSTKFVFFGPIGKTRWPPLPLIGWDIFTSPLKPLKGGIQRNLTGSKISTSSTKFVFFRPISKQKCPHWPISQRGGTLYSGARYVALWASCLQYWGVESLYLECMWHVQNLTFIMFISHCVLF